MNHIIGNGKNCWRFNALPRFQTADHASCKEDTNGAKSKQYKRFFRWQIPTTLIRNQIFVAFHFLQFVTECLAQVEHEDRLQGNRRLFFSPKVALFIFTIFIVSYLIFFDEEGAFNEKFLHFGPGTTEENTPTFLGIKVDTWPKTIMLYIVGFFSALLTTYYQTVMGQNLHSYIWNKAIDTVPFSKTWTYAIVILEPFFYKVLQIVQFFTNLTLQVQFIVPQFIGSYIADVPFTIRMLGDKRFDQI